MHNKIVLAALIALAVTPAFAHVTLTDPNALPGAHYVAHFRVGHGCSGSPTIALAVTIPEGVSGIQPDAKAGWTLEISHAGSHVSTVTWKGGTLAADKPDEFTIAMTLPGQPGTLAFAATQTCENGVESWTELPAVDGHKLKNPAPLLHVSPTPTTAMPGMKTVFRK
jgi:uncharacterized protein YcnI